MRLWQRAMEEGRVDVFRAMQLARVRDPSRFEELCEAAHLTKTWRLLGIQVEG
jgi:hypothetical protein